MSVTNEHEVSYDPAAREAARGEVFKLFNGHGVTEGSEAARMAISVLPEGDGLRDRLVAREAESGREAGE